MRKKEPRAPTLMYNVSKFDSTHLVIIKTINYQFRIQLKYHIARVDFTESTLAPSTSHEPLQHTHQAEVAATVSFPHKQTKLILEAHSNAHFVVFSLERSIKITLHKPLLEELVHIRIIRIITTVPI